MADERAQQLSAEVSRVSGRLRTLGHARLARPLSRSSATHVRVARSVADAAHDLAQQLADLVAEAEGRPRRPVPRLGDHAVGDQVAVTGNDLVALARSGGLDRDRLDRAVELLRDLRLTLP